LSERVGRRARRYGHKGKTITLTVRYKDFTTFTRQTTLPISTNDTREIYCAAIALLDGIRLQKSVRLLGVSLSGLRNDGGQMLLFEEANRQRKAALTKAVDTIKDKFGEHAVTLASTITQEEEHRVISPAWRPSGVRKSDV
jgi:DNA polymerase-4